MSVQLRTISSVKTSAALALTAGAAVLLAPTASADQSTFITDVANEGSFPVNATYPPAVYLKVGQMACGVLARGNDSALNSFEHATMNTFHVSFPDAVQFVVLANRDLCPNA